MHLTSKESLKDNSIYRRDPRQRQGSYMNFQNKKIKANQKVFQTKCYLIWKIKFWPATVRQRDTNERENKNNPRLDILACRYLQGRTTDWNILNKSIKYWAYSAYSISINILNKPKIRQNFFSKSLHKKKHTILYN